MISTSLSHLSALPMDRNAQVLNPEEQKPGCQRRCTGEGVHAMTVLHPSFAILKNKQ